MKTAQIVKFQSDELADAPIFTKKEKDYVLNNIEKTILFKKR
jgi:hypothetical protein